MKFSHLVRNLLLTRKSWLSKLLDPRRDIDAECGHPETLTIDNYKSLFLRGDVAARVVRLFPEETWSEDPEIYETEDKNDTDFEEAWKELLKVVPVFAMLQRADVLSGIGRYGILLLGLDDGAQMSQPIEGLNEDGTWTENPAERNLIFVRALDESVVSIDKLENNIASPRYGMPVEYSVQFADITSGLLASPTSNLTTQKVHWSRVIHIADNRTNSEIYGQPRMEVVVNRLLDLKKIAGGSGEMFWKGGFPGLSIETQPTDEDIEFDEAATKTQIEDYMNGLQRYIATVGMTAKSLSPNIADPVPHMELQLKLIATAMSVPWRILVGSEAAQLASAQDTKSWNKRITRRRLDYVNPFMIKPLVDRLIGIGVLPTPADGYEVDWPDPNAPSDQEKADVADKRSNALAKYVQSGSDLMVPPFEYLTHFLDMDEEEAQAITDAAEKQGSRIDVQEPAPAPQPGRGNGQVPRRGITPVTPQE